MRTTVLHPRFARRHLEVVGWVPGSPSGLTIDGDAVKSSGGVYRVRDDSGAAVAIRIDNGTLFSPTFQLHIGDDVIILESPLTLLQLIVAALPIALVIIGGAIGGGIGAVATSVNFAIMRASWPAAVRYLSSLVVTFASVAAFLIVIDAVFPVDAAYLAKAATASNKELPKQIDATTRLDAVRAEADKGLVFEFALKVPDHFMPDDAFMNVARTNSTTAACDAVEARKILKAGKSLRYLYRDLERRFIAEVTVTIADCPK